MNKSNKEIRNSIVYAFLKRQPEYFIPYLMSQNTYVDDDNKMKFYKLFKHNILNSKINGKITDIKVEKELNGFYNDEFVELESIKQNLVNINIEINKLIDNHIHKILEKK